MNDVQVQVRVAPEWVVDRTQADKYTCAICMCIMTSPTSLDKCIHLFCADCIKQVQTKTCPLCRNAWTATMVVNNMSKEIDVLGIKCPCRKWSGELRKFEEHVKSGACEETPALCACGVPMIKSKLSKHLKTKCPEAKTVCKHCLLPIVRKEKAKHHADCGSFPVECKQCSQAMARRSLAAHQKLLCSGSTMACRFCLERITRSTLQAHLKSKCSAQTVICPDCYTVVSVSDFQLHGCPTGGKTVRREVEFPGGSGQWHPAVWLSVGDHAVLLKSDVLIEPQWMPRTSPYMRVVVV